MTEPYTPNFGTILRLYHLAISRGIDVGAERSQVFAEKGYPDGFLREGFLTFLRTLNSVTRGHNLAEDQVAFPYFRTKIVEAPFDQLSAQHKEIATILGEIDAGTTQGGNNMEEKVALRHLRMALIRLHGIWRLHTQAEEDFMRADKLDTLLTPDAQAQLVQKFQGHSLKNSEPDFLTIPFTLFNLQPDERALFARTLPPSIVEDLIPGEWRKQWAPMLPFLLVEEKQRVRVVNREAGGEQEQG